jgi:hypothetical protein
VPEPFSVESLCKAIAEQRGRPIFLIEEDMPPDCSGLWVWTDTDDIIMYDRRTSRVHQQHIILHEIGHLLAGHDAVPAIGNQRQEFFLPFLDPALAQRMLCRTHYTDPEEEEAEVIASLLRERNDRWRPRLDWTPRPQAAGLARRLERSLEQHQDLD